MVRVHADETPANRRVAKDLIERWSRPILAPRAGAGLDAEEQQRILEARQQRQMRLAAQQAGIVNMAAVAATGRLAHLRIAAARSCLPPTAVMRRVALPAAAAAARRRVRRQLLCAGVSSPAIIPCALMCPCCVGFIVVPPACGLV